MALFEYELHFSASLRLCGIICSSLRLCGVCEVIMNNQYAIGVDLGGTNLRVGVIREDGHVEAEAAIPVGTEKSADRIAGLIGEHVAVMQQQVAKSMTGCGLGIPGIVDSERGIIFSSPNFREWQDVEMLRLLRKTIELPMVIDNDANMFALAELLYGAGKGHKNLIMLTLGSGIGGGIVIDGKVFHGDRGFAGEVGHIVVEPDGVPCGCQGHGCWEQYAAGCAFTHLVHRLPKHEREAVLAEVYGDANQLSPELIARLAGQGNTIARELWRSYGRYLGIGIASLINVLGITTIVIGGGIARSWDHFIDATRAEIASRTYRKNVQHLKLLPASLGDNTGIVGAASAVFQKGA